MVHMWRTIGGLHWRPYGLVNLVVQLFLGIHLVHQQWTEVTSRILKHHTCGSFGNIYGLYCIFKLDLARVFVSQVGL